jgi:hypothetical protein
MLTRSPTSASFKQICLLDLPERLPVAGLVRELQSLLGRLLGLW